MITITIVKTLFKRGKNKKHCKGGRNTTSASTCGRCRDLPPRHGASSGLLLPPMLRAAQYSQEESLSPLLSPSTVTLAALTGTGQSLWETLMGRRGDSPASPHEPLLCTEGAGASLPRSCWSHSAISTNVLCFCLLKCVLLCIAGEQY